MSAKRFSTTVSVKPLLETRMIFLSVSSAASYLIKLNAWWHVKVTIANANEEEMSDL
jgi:hypothetical protein